MDIAVMEEVDVIVMRQRRVAAPPIMGVLMPLDLGMPTFRVSTGNVVHITDSSRSRWK